MTEEVWKDIPGYEGLYQASTLGRIRSLDKEIIYYREWNQRTQKRKGRILKPYTFVNGCMAVVLYKDGIPETKYVHRLVAMTFLENPKGHKMVTFRDNNKNNTKLENLRWGRKD